MSNPASQKHKVSLRPLSVLMCLSTGRIRAQTSTIKDYHQSYRARDVKSTQLGSMLGRLTVLLSPYTSAFSTQTAGFGLSSSLPGRVSRSVSPGVISFSQNHSTPRLQVSKAYHLTLARDDLTLSWDLQGFPGRLQGPGCPPPSLTGCLNLFPPV